MFETKSNILGYTYPEVANLRIYIYIYVYNVEGLRISKQK